MPAIQPNRRIKIVRGDARQIDRSNNVICGYHDCIHWVAGNVPVGTVGTTLPAKEGDKARMITVAWDGFMPKDNRGVFGIGIEGRNLGDQFVYVD